MPNYQFTCPDHGVFDLTLPLRKWSDKKPCPQCKKTSEQVLLPSQGRGTFEVGIVVHVAGDGSVRFPGHRDAKCPKGFHRKELKSVREVEQFERQMNHKLRNEAEQHNDREEKIFKEVQEKNRSDLRQSMRNMSPQGRAFAQFAIDRNNNRKRKSSEVGFHCQILHFDQPNREHYRDAETNWQRKRV
jgi:putative FmdB family regulatory protein